MEENYNTVESSESVKKQPIWVFCLLCFCSFGFYTLYWFYRNWSFFKRQYGWDIYPVWRAIFGIFFVHSLLENINDLALEKGHSGIRSNWYATSFVILAIIQRMLDRTLPEPLVVVALFIPPFLCLIPSVRQLNYMAEQTDAHQYQPAISPGEFVLLILGGIMIVLVIAGLFMRS